MNKNTIKEIVIELERAFDFFNKYFYNSELPKCIITIATGSGKRLTNGWFAANRWKTINKERIHEINISAEILTEKTEKNNPEIIVTLLHEMVHLYSQIKNIKDISSNGIHLSKTFGKIANEKGLTVLIVPFFPRVVTPDLNTEGIKAFQELKFQESIFDKFRLDEKFLALKKPPEDTEQGEDGAGEGEEDTETGIETPKKIKRQKKIFCPLCNDSIYVANGFNKSLFCNGSEDEPHDPEHLIEDL